MTLNDTVKKCKDGAVVAGTFLSKYRRAFKRVLITLLLLGFFLISALTLVGGSSPPLKQGIEQYFSEVTNLRARIGALEKVTFYPNISLHVKDVAFHPLKGPLEKNEKTPITLKELHISMPFWRYVLGMRYIETLAVSELIVRDKTLIPAPFSIESIAIKEKETSQNGKHQSHAIVKGVYNDRPLSVSLDLEKKDIKRGRAFYRKPKDSIFQAELGDLKFSANINQPHGSKTVFENISFQSGEDTLSGFLKISGSSKIKITSDLMFGSSNLQARGFHKKNMWKGNLNFLPIAIQDIGAFYRMMQSVRTHLFLEQESEGANAEISLPSFDMQWNTKLRLENESKETLAAIQFPLILQDGALQLSPIQGEVLNGRLEGKAALLAQDLPATLSLDIILDDYDLGQINKTIESGNTHSAINIGSEGKTYADLLSHMAGHITFWVSGGRFDDRWVHTFAGGLFNALIPDFKPQDELVLNCAIAHFEVEKGVARAKTLLADGKRLTVAGEGSIDLREGRYDLTLEPQSKDVALLDVATSVDVTGPLHSPRVSPNMLSLGAKIGGLLAGAINPAFLAFSLTDLGITEEHPCASYFQQDTSEVSEDKE